MRSFKIILALLIIVLLTSPLVGQTSGGGRPTGDISIAFASLGTPINGSHFYCTNCQATAPCTSGGTGAFAYRVAGAWNCTTGSSGGLAASGATVGATLQSQVFTN